MPKEGDKAPSFNMPTSTGENVSLSKLKGKKVVLYFYPRDLTPGCVKEACGFRDDLEKLERAGAVVIGVSKDSIESHRKFIKKYDLNFIFLLTTMLTFVTFLISLLSATAAIGLFLESRLVINTFVLSDTIFPFHLLGLKGLIGVMANFFEFNDSIGP